MTETPAPRVDAAIEPAIDIDVDHDSVPGRTRVEVRGEIDMLTAPRLREALEEHFAQAGASVLIDMNHVSFLGSAGLQLLVEIQEVARSTGAELALVCSSRQILRPLSMTGLDKMFTIYPSCDAVPSGD